MKGNNIINHTSIISNTLIIVFQAILLLVPFLALGISGTNSICVVSFVINGTIFCIGMYGAYKKHAVSMELIYWIFMFFFMYFAPVIQYRLSTYPWRGRLTDKEILFANIIIFVFNVFFVIGKRIAKRIKIKEISKLNIENFLCANFELKKTTRIVLTIIVCLLAAYSFSKTGIWGIIVARAQAVQVFYSGENSAIELIIESVIPAFMAYMVVEAAQNVVSKKENGIRFLLLLFCLVICFFPTTIPRYKMATIYGAIFLVLFPRLKKGALFFWIFILSMFLIFPLLSSVRNVIMLDNFLNVFSNGIIETYVRGDYDAYRMLVSAIRYVQDNGCLLGYQFLGVLLFFVPKSIWPSKPEGSGSMLIKDELGNNAFSNVSCPFIAEGYINLGWLGIVLFSLALGAVIYKLDTWYWTKTKDDKHIVFAPYLFMVFMLFFVLRGDLLSGFAYMCGFIVTGCVLKVIAKCI